MTIELDGGRKPLFFFLHRKWPHATSTPGAPGARPMPRPLKSTRREHCANASGLPRRASIFKKDTLTSLKFAAHPMATPQVTGTDAPTDAPIAPQSSAAPKVTGTDAPTDAPIAPKSPALTIDKLIGSYKTDESLGGLVEVTHDASTGQVTIEHSGKKKWTRVRRVLRTLASPLPHASRRERPRRRAPTLGAGRGRISTDQRHGRSAL